MILNPEPFASILNKEKNQGRGKIRIQRTRKVAANRGGRGRHMDAYYADGRGRYGTGESYDYFYQYEGEDVPILTSSDGLWTYAADEEKEGIVLLRYNGNAIHIVVPQTVDGKRVVSLDSTFDGFYELKSVVVPDGVRSIVGAFYGCEELEEVTLPDCVEDLEYALNSCYALKEVRIPAHARYFRNAFSGTGLEHIVFPPETEDISAAFCDSEALCSAVIPGSVTDMSEAFSDCESLTSVILEEGITEIGDYAFSDCTALKELTIPASVTTFGKDCIGIMEIREYTDSRKSAYKIKGYQVVPGFRIKGVAGSEAEKYARAAGISFVPVEKQNGLQE